MIRQEFADDQNIALKIQTLDEVGISFFAKDGDANNRAADNRGVKVTTPRRGATDIHVRVWPKHEDPPRHVAELAVPLHALEKHGESFLHNIGDREFTTATLLSHILNESVDEIVRTQPYVPLLAAATAGRQDLLEDLVSRGQNVNERTVFGWTALLMAAAHGYPEMVKYLLEHGANPDIPNVHGITPLMYAARYGNLPIAEVLLDFGAYINLQDVYGDTALAVATRTGHEAIVRLLLESGADASIRNRDGETPIDQAHHVGRGDIARLLRRRRPC